MRFYYLGFDFVQVRETSVIPSNGSASGASTASKVSAALPTESASSYKVTGASSAMLKISPFQAVSFQR